MNNGRTKMKCKICGSDNIKVTYKGRVRDGCLGKYTDSDTIMYQCSACGVIWHDVIEGRALESYYESSEYRNSLEGSSEECAFYEKHDFETLAKLQYTGTDIYRNRTVADIGCGCGSFLDFLKGVARELIAVEPSEAYRDVLTRKGFKTFVYMSDLIQSKDFIGGGVDIATSFDVIEHVHDPRKFLEEIYTLLKDGGRAIIGTPTEAPIMRQLLGEIYERKLLFSTQHLWVFSEKNLMMLAENAGFQKIEIKYFQRYGLGNLLGWLRDKEPRSEIKGDFLTPAMEAVWKSECGRTGLADYIVLYVCKE